MIIKITPATRAIDIEDAGNFRAFKVSVEGAGDDPAGLDELLRGIATHHDREHAWIAERWLRSWPALANEAWWQDGLTSMIASVRKFGWVDEASHGIRAHIEYTT